MTRPSEIKPQEGSVAGTTYKQYQEGQSLGPITFDITPEICDEYFDSVQADRSLYVLDGRQAASPTVLLPYMTVPIYQTYPPNQGIVMAELNMQWSAPLWADESTTIVATGKVLRKFEKRGRHFVQWEAIFCRTDGSELARLTNTFHIPE